MTWLMTLSSVVRLLQRTDSVRTTKQGRYNDHGQVQSNCISCPRHQTGKEHTHAKAGIAYNTIQAKPRRQTARLSKTKENKKLRTNRQMEKKKKKKMTMILNHNKGAELERNN